MQGIVPELIGRCVELFVEQMMHSVVKVANEGEPEGGDTASASANQSDKSHRGRKTIMPSHIDRVILSDMQYDFLADIARHGSGDSGSHASAVGSSSLSAHSSCQPAALTNASEDEGEEDE